MSKTKKFRVFLKQVNQEMYVVTASNSEEATEKAIRKWKRDNYPGVEQVVEITKPWH